MEPISSSVMIGGVVAYLAGKLAKDESISDFFSQFSGAAVKWLKPLFLKEDNTEREVILNLKQKPTSSARKKALESVFEISIEDNPETISYLKEIYQTTLNKKEGSGSKNTIVNSKNVITGNINTGGGTLHVGDKK